MTTTSLGSLATYVQLFVVVLGVYFVMYIAASLLGVIEQGAVLSLADSSCQLGNLKLEYTRGESIEYCILVYSYYTSPEHFRLHISVNNTPAYTFQLLVEPYTFGKIKFRVLYDKTGIYVLEAKLYRVINGEEIDTGREVRLYVRVE